MPPLDVDHSARSPIWNKRGSFPSTSLTHGNIHDALQQSQDNGVTLVFLKKGITDISAEMVEELATIGRQSPDDESCVERLALGSNRLAALPMEFALLSRLRYVNLKSNNFSTFPSVLTQIPSLDTLDISHNKIKRLPSLPGHLVNLRVFSVSRNKLSRLPTYLSQFTQLAVLELERNPVEWPPRSIMDRPAKFPSPDAMKAWVRNLQKWMDTEALRSAKSLNDSGFLEHHDLESNLADSYDSWSRFPHSESDEGPTPHARNFSIDSTLSVSSVAESDLETPHSSYDQSSDRPPALHLGMLQSYSTSNSPTRSIESYLPSPADSDTFFESTTHSTLAQPPHQHGRNASYAPGAHRTSNSASLPGKKSMPDLRTAKLNFTKTVPELPDRQFPLATSTPIRNKGHEDFSIPSPLSQRQDSGSSSSSRLARQQPPAPLSNPPFSEPIPSMAFERNSYFRRLSTLPTNVISNTLPKPLLCFIDSARSILFAVCQIYQALEHYTLHAIDDRLSSVLRKVLDPASADMMQLINSLDRFDVMSRKTIPPPLVCRAVVESCKDTVSAFGKTISVLSLQLKVLGAGDDVRYLRALLLTLYGASAEISSAWNSMVPHIEAIKPLLHSRPFPGASPPVGHFNGSSELPASAPANGLPFQWEQPPFSSLRSASAVGGGRTRTLRRHAGSFSSKDVEIGKKLPSYDEPPPMSRGVALYTPTLRTPTRSRTNGTPMPSPLPSSPQPPPAAMIASSDSSLTNHSRSGSLASLTQTSSTSSSPSIPPKSNFLELPSASKVQVDKEALQAVQDAVDVAPTVWSMMEDVMADVLEAKPDVRETLDVARAVTRRLGEAIRTAQDGDSSVDKKSLRQDAHLFLKTVVQLSNIIKTHGGVQSSTLRNNLVKLTNSTEEFAILLHVSSYSPSSTPRSFSPMLSPSISQPNLTHPDDSRFTSPMSRSRSAQPTVTSFKGLIHPMDGSRSALPSQSFKVPVIRRVRGHDPG